MPQLTACGRLQRTPETQLASHNRACCASGAHLGGPNRDPSKSRGLPYSNACGLARFVLFAPCCGSRMKHSRRMHAWVMRSWARLAIGQAHHAAREHYEAWTESRVPVDNIRRSEGMRVPLGTGMWLCPKHRRATLWIKCRRVAAHGGKSSRLVTRSRLAAATYPRLKSRKLVKEMEMERDTSANLSSSVRTAFLRALRGGTRHEARSAVLCFREAGSTRSSCFETFGTTSPKLLEPRNFKPRWWRNARDCKMPAALQQPLLEHWLSTTLTAETCCKALPRCAPRCAMAIKPPAWPCQRNGAATRRREQRALTSRQLATNSAHLWREPSGDLEQGKAHRILPWACLSRKGHMRERCPVWRLFLQNAGKALRDAEREWQPALDNSWRRHFRGREDELAE